MCLTSSPQLNENTQDSSTRVETPQTAFFPSCKACSHPILTRFALGLSRVSTRPPRMSSSCSRLVQRPYHTSCLRCSRCHLCLDDDGTRCWANRIYGILCEACHKSQTHCAKCQHYLPSNTWVYRTFDFPFHVACFTCGLCNLQLHSGNCVVFVDGDVHCAGHYSSATATTTTQLPQVVQDWEPTDSAETPPTGNSLATSESDRSGVSSCASSSYLATLQRSSPGVSEAADEATDDITPQKPPDTRVGSPLDGRLKTRFNPKRQQQQNQSRSIYQRQTAHHHHGYHLQRAKRIRTSFTPQQIAILQTSFDAEANPDGQELERIAVSARLNKRVTQVWFQNARARKKKIARMPETPSGSQDGALHPQSLRQPRALDTSEDNKSNRSRNEFTLNGGLCSVWSSSSSRESFPCVPPFAAFL